MTPPERLRFYKAIRGRLEVGDSVAQFAARAELSRSTMYSWTGGKIDPEWESLRRVASELRLPMWVLVREIELEPAKGEWR